jgi:hypothetical protein
VRVLGRRTDGAFFHLDQPAHRLVVADRGDRALALAHRDEALRVARLDLVARRTEVWCEAVITAFAPDFDGAEWVVADSERILSIDAAYPGFEALHAFPLDARAIQIARSQSACAVLTEEQGSGGFCLRLELPSWTLRARKPFLRAEPGLVLEHVLGLHTTAVASLLRRAPEKPRPWPLDSADPMSPHVTLLWTNQADAERRIDLSTLADPPLCVALAAGWVACAFREKAGVMVRLFDEAELKERAAIALRGAQKVCLRLRDETLTVGDDRGRALVIELVHGSVIRSIRT